MTALYPPPAYPPVLPVPADSRPSRWAADTVAALREGARLRLDYTARSLWRVDRVIDEIRRDGPPYEAVRRVLRGFGAYAGEVVVRHTGAEWRLTDADPDPCLRTPDGRLWTPMDEARRAYEGDGSLGVLCREAIGGR